MKYILFIIFLLSGMASQGQTTFAINQTTPALYFSGGSNLYFSSGDVVSHYDTVFLFKGIDTIAHECDFVSKSIKQGMYSGNISCLVMHGPTGCPDTWMHKDFICFVCLKNFTVKETVTIKPKIDLYQDAKDRLNKLKH